MILIRYVPTDTAWPAGRSVLYVSMETDAAACSDCGRRFRRGARAFVIYDRAPAAARIVHPKGKCGA